MTACAGDRNCCDSCLDKNDCARLLRRCFPKRELEPQCATCEKCEGIRRPGPADSLPYWERARIHAALHGDTPAPDIKPGEYNSAFDLLRAQEKPAEARTVSRGRC